MTAFIDERKRKYDMLVSERTNWNNAWQLVAQYIYTIKANFLNKDDTKGEFLNSHLYDNSANKAMRTRASALVALLWGDFKIADIDPKLMEQASINEYYEKVTKELKAVFKKSLIEKVLLELEKSDATFGTDCMLITEDALTEEIIIQSITLEELYIDEDSKGFVDTVYRPYSLTAAQVIQEYGEENVHQNIKDLVSNGGENTKVNLLHVIQPYASSIHKPKVKLKYESTTIDLKNEHVLKEKGFFEKPFMVYRENKKDDEKYGRGCGMETISNILQANANGENYIESTNKQARPSKGVFSEAMPSNGIIDLSPDAVTVFNSSGLISGKPIFNMEEFISGNLEVMRLTAADLREIIASDFDIDRLLDLGNDVEMTAFEVANRARERQRSLGGMLKTKIKERYDPMMKRILSILYRQDKLGYVETDQKYIELSDLGKEPLLIPKEIQERFDKNEDVFEIVWFTENSREEQLVKSSSYLNVWQSVGIIAEMTQDPSVFDNLDQDKTAQLLAETSFSSEIIKDEETREADREARRERQKTQALLNAGEQASVIDKNLANSKPKKK